MVLECLMRNKNIVMTRQQIEQNAWDFDFEGGSNVIDVYIRYLRKKSMHNMNKNSSTLFAVSDM